MYVITVPQWSVTQLTKELKAWGIPDSKYVIKKNILTTKSANVVDVITETFINVRNLIKIVKLTKRGAVETKF